MQCLEANSSSPILNAVYSIDWAHHLCPGFHAAAKFAIFRVLEKNGKNRKVDDGRSVHSRFFAVLSVVNDISRKRVANFAKIAKNRMANDFACSLAIFRSSVIRNDYPARNRSISRSSFHGLATALRCFTTTPRKKDLVCFWFRLRKYL